MSRSGYSDDCDGWSLICWRGAVASAMNGARGQAFLKEMLAALDAMPEHKLIAGKLEQSGEVCAIGSIGKARGVSMSNIDPGEREIVAALFGIAPAMAAEIVYINDDYGPYKETPEQRWQRMHDWVQQQIIDTPPIP